MLQINKGQMVDIAFQKCAERGWLPELVPSTITNQEIADFEEKYQFKLPHLYRAFLTSYQLPCSMFEINGIAYHMEDISPLWLILYGINSMSELSERIEFFREDAEDFRQASTESCQTLIPIGDWGAGWGSLCIDLTKNEELIDENDESTWSLVWFDHEEFDWGRYYSGEDGMLQGSPAAPNFQTLLEWYFCGSLEPELEEENQVKVSYERLNNREFCNSYWEDKWKE